MTFTQPASSIRNRYAAGKRLRRRLPREKQDGWTPSAGRPNPQSTLASVTPGRLPTLLAEKHRRMQASPFAFFRGAAVLMGSDLATLPRTGIVVQLCGDAHVRNLGAYAAPDGRLVFDINDFDETAPGPWEWDVKRLATSLVLAGEEAGQSEGHVLDGVRAFVASYRRHLLTFATMPFTSRSNRNCHRA